MNLSRVRTVFAKELLEIRKNRTLLFTIFLPPLLLTLLPLGILAVLGSDLSQSNMSASDLARYAQAFPELVGLPPGDMLQVVIMRQFLVMYLMLPLIIPTAIASASIIGEKEHRSLEPLLATPIKTSELLLAKSVAAMLPAVLATWLTYGIFFVGARLVVHSDRVFNALLNPVWLLAMLVLAPLLSLLSVSLSVIISSRVNDTRVAQQLAGLVVIPVVLFAVGQTAGFVLVNTYVFAIASIVVALIDVGVLYAGVQLFDRETILTRWK
ncbi:MAG: ABC transporter permease subunit [Chloroflexota bacterium]